MPEGTPPARGAGRARGRGATRGRGRGAATSATPSGETPSGTPISRPSSALGTASAAGAPTRSDSATPKPTRGTSVGRFRPRAVRRDEASRDVLARQELEKDNARAKAEARAQARSRGRSRRARGDAMGRGGMMSRAAVASGPFSQIHFEGGSRSSGGWGGGGGGSGSGGGFFGGGGRAKSEKGAFGEASGHRREARINADRLAGHLVDREPDSDDEATAALINSKPDNIWPMGIARIDKKEEKKVIATTAELEAAEDGKTEESLWVDEGGTWSGPVPQVEEETKVWHAAPKGDVQVKAEPGTEPGAMEVDLSVVKPADTETEEKVTPEPKVKKALADPEVDMITQDMQLLLSELGTVSDENSKAPENSAVQDKDGRLYLFQFPPLLPPLHPSVAPKVKPEPDDLVMLDQPAGGSVDLTNSEDNIKPKIEEDDRDVDLTDISQLVSQAGMMGKLKVRKSGKVELDWGGRTLELSPAAGMNFLTTAVIVEESDEKSKQGVIGGDSIGMGKIMGRFVLAPTWGDEEDWVVDPEDLVIPEESG
ncbi:DNA-directed RNA polymerase iii [Colletotrichum truncatum]|uniref:DNA-directed RNA polymerase iii n=1 Tax=Colletotrichum truncatum TaxID=5467 RepID=A0ACC3ZJ35_COLTU|nr:DNA-directed RNA polymerase iii [Colletotrichum truncatum]KAF6791957.1 DNA-directed RNA polymerase iii [Colletotrichum truncatum]